MAFKQQTMLSEKRSHDEQVTSSFQPKKRIMVVSDNCNHELNPNVKLYLDGKFNNLATKLSSQDSLPGHVEEQLNEFKKELSDMLENQTRDIVELIKESHKQILETVESKLETPTKIQPSTTEAIPIKKAGKKVIRFSTLGTVIRAYLRKLDEMGQGWDFGCVFSSKNNEKVTNAIIDHVLNNPALNSYQFDNTEYSKKVNEIRSKVKNFFYNSRKKYYLDEMEKSEA